jgi:hypothetical protein
MPNCTLVKSSYAIPANRSGCTTVGNKRGESFEMNADFQGTGSSECRCCEYRQYVRGYGRYRANSASPWTTVNHLLRWGVPLSPVNYNEDGFSNGSAYGYRAFNGCSDDFLPHPRTTGCQYRGTDYPGLTLPTGYQYDVQLDFIGQIVDVCNSNTVIQSSAWTVSCQGVI